jgi:plasmid stabilization system protein ParE
VGQLPEYPKRCRAGQVEATRELFVPPNYSVIYAESASAVRVLRVLHAAQMWP